jgi:hypothetical protein
MVLLHKISQVFFPLFWPQCFFTVFFLGKRRASLSHRPLCKRCFVRHLQPPFLIASLLLTFGGGLIVVLISFFFWFVVGRACRFFLRAFTGLAWRSQGKSIKEPAIQINTGSLWFYWDSVLLNVVMFQFHHLRTYTLDNLITVIPQTLVGNNFTYYWLALKSL